MQDTVEASKPEDTECTLPAFLLHPSLYHLEEDGTFVSASAVPYKQVHESQVLSNTIDFETNRRFLDQWLCSKQLRVQETISAVMDTSTSDLFVIDMILSKGMEVHMNRLPSPLSSADTVFASVLLPGQKRDRVALARRHMRQVRSICKRSYYFCPQTVLLRMSKNGVVLEEDVT